MTDNVINKCSICLEPLDTTQETCLLTCEHQFHLACCQNWFSQPTNTKHSCALCNKEYVEIELIFNTIPVEKSKNKTKNKTKVKTKNAKHPKQLHQILPKYKIPYQVNEKNCNCCVIL